MIEEIAPKPISGKNAFIWIFLFTVTVSGSVILGYLYYAFFLEQRMNDPKFHITTIEHSIFNKQSLSTTFLAEVLGISEDKPINLYRFSISEGVEKLLQTSLISQCQIRKKIPSTLLIEYHVRSPIAILSDYEGALIDSFGVIFPKTPFFENISLPRLYFGNQVLEETKSDIVWGEKCNHVLLDIALRVLESVKKFKEIQYCEIDLSKATDESYGRRELTFILQDPSDHTRHVLRCNLLTYEEDLSRYQKLRSFLKKNRDEMQQMIIDLRIPKLAFVKEIEINHCSRKER